MRTGIPCASRTQVRRRCTSLLGDVERQKQLDLALFAADGSIAHAAVTRAAFSNRWRSLQAGADE